MLFSHHKDHCPASPRFLCLSALFLPPPSRDAFVSWQEAASQVLAQQWRDAVGVAVATGRAQGAAWITDMAVSPGKGTLMPLFELTLQCCCMGGDCPAHF